MTKPRGKSLMILVVILLLVGVSAVLLLREADCTDTVRPDGTHRVGVRIVHVEYGKRKMPVMMWYPAEPGPAAPTFLYNTRIRGQAVLDAPFERGGSPYPVILFSHGLGECGCMSVYYTENLASFGYVVVAPDHQDSLMCRVEGEPDIRFIDMTASSVKSMGDLNDTVANLFGDYLTGINYDFSYRARETRAVLNRVLDWNRQPGSFLQGMIDAEKIGMSGHSLGGFTSLVVGGLPFRCDERERDPDECDSRKTNLDAVDLCCMDAIRNLRDPFELRDRRVKAILPLGPALFFPNLERAAAELEVPIMTITGDDLRMEVPWGPIWTLHTNAPPPKYVIRLRKTDHMTIADFLRTRAVTRAVYPGYRFNFEEKAQAYKDYSVAFFDLHLKGKEAGKAVLRGPANRFVELWQEPG